MLTSNRLCLCAAVHYVLLFLGKFRPVSNFMWLHALTLATHSLLSGKSVQSLIRSHYHVLVSYYFKFCLFCVLFCFSQEKNSQIT